MVKVQSISSRANQVSNEQFVRVGAYILSAPLLLIGILFTVAAASILHTAIGVAMTGMGVLMISQVEE